MPRHETVACSEGEFTELTNADVASLTFQVLSGASVHIVVKNGAAIPANTSGSLRYSKGQGEVGKLLADIAPGITSPNRVFAFSTEGTAQISVSHA